MTFSKIVIWCQREKKKSCGMGLVKTGFRDVVGADRARPWWVAGGEPTVSASSASKTSGSP